MKRVIFDKALFFPKTVGIHPLPSSCLLFGDDFFFVCLFVLRLNVPVNNFSVMSGRSHGGGRFRTPDLSLRIRVVSPTFPFAPESFRPLSLSPRVVSPPGRFAHFPVRPWVVSPTFPFAPESFRHLIKFYFYYQYFGLKSGIKLWFSC